MTKHTIAIPKDKFAILSKIHKVASTDTSTDSRRSILTSVKISLVGDQLTVVATDSYALAEYTTTVASGDGDFDVIVDAKQFAKLSKLYHKPLEFFTIVLDDIFVTIGGLDGSVTQPIAPGKFPDYKQLIPKLGPTDTKILNSVNSKLLATLISILPIGTPIKLLQDEGRNLAPIIVDNDIDGLTLLIMPVK